MTTAIENLLNPEERRIMWKQHAYPKVEYRTLTPFNVIGRIFNGTNGETPTNAYVRVRFSGRHIEVLDANDNVLTEKWFPGAGQIVILNGYKTVCKKAIWIKVDDISKDPTYKHEYEKMFANLGSLQELYKEGILDLFAQKFDPWRKKIVDELLPISADRNAVRNWLIANDFKGVPVVEEFPVEGIPDLGGWSIDSRPDGYGHQCGSNMGIDWETRELRAYSWSSDD